MNILKNKKGDEKYLSIWWFLMLIIVFLAIAAGVFIFYSSPIDARQVEAQVLYNKISNCLVREGFLVDSVLEKDFDIFSECGLSKSVFQEETGFYFHISFTNETGRIREDIIEGDYSHENDCGLSENTEARNFPRCYRNIQSFSYFEDGENKKGTLSSLTSSNNNGRKIPVTQ